MGITVKVLGISWIVSVLAVTSFAAANDLRLVGAAQNGDRETVKSLLKQHVNVNTPQADGATALAWAVYWDDLETVDLLLHANANPNAANDYGVTPLSLACTNGSAAAVEKLLKAGANPNAAEGAGETVLMKCARAGSGEAVQALLARGADVKAKDSRQGHTALMWAAVAKHPEVVRLLIEHGADINAASNTGFSSLMFAAQQDDMDSARILLAGGANVNAANEDGDTALLVASLSGHEAFSIFLLDNGANPNAADRNGVTAMHYAILRGLVQIVGVTDNRRAIAPYILRPNMVELVKALLAHGADPNARLQKPAANGSGPGYGKILRIDRINAGVEPGRPVGATPFLLAALTIDAKLMRILAAGGADPKLGTAAGLTPLMVASGLGRVRRGEEKDALEAVKVAVELGADVNATSNIGLTALHGAAMSGANSIVQFLVEKGANLDAIDKAGQTPLAKALNIRPKDGLENMLFPNTYRKSTAELLLKLGATPVDASLARRGPADAAAGNQ